MLKRLLREPLLHFLALAAMVFAVNGVLGRSEAGKPEEIIVSQARIDQLAALFARTWQRAPTAVELKGLIDDYVKEEILVREAQALGLDRDDMVIRRRLRFKMEFLNNAENELPTPTDADLSGYLRANPGKFEIEPSFAFQQIFLSPDRHGEKIDRDAAAILETLRASASIDPSEFGDATLLPFRLERTGKASIGQIFGPEFADALDQIPPGQWSSPIASAFGLHLVRVTDRRAARLPGLDEIRANVAREWTDEKRTTLEDRRFAALLTRYRITIEKTSQGTPRGTSGP
jgi:PPIC-type PPIASE domain